MPRLEPPVPREQRLTARPQAQAAPRESPRGKDAKLKGALANQVADLDGDLEVLSHFGSDTPGALGRLARAGKTKRLPIAPQLDLDLIRNRVVRQRDARLLGGHGEAGRIRPSDLCRWDARTLRRSPGVKIKYI